MSNSFVYFSFLTKIGCCLTFLTNCLLIYLTVAHIKMIIGVYKYMIIIFSLLGITFSIIEQIARPYVHNYNKGIMFFSFGWDGVPEDVMQTGLVIYALFYVLIVAFVAVQFVYRYVTLISPELCTKFEGFGVMVWGSYPLVVGTLNGLSIFIMAYPDKFGDEYMRGAILDVYDLSISKVPRLLIIPYDSENHIRWLNLFYLFSGSFCLLSQYSIIVFCGLRMQSQMQKELQKFSIPNRKLQKQFFKALVIQIIVPTVIFVFPSTPILLVPLLNIEISVQSGAICSLLSLYPPIDSLVFMIVVSEYRKIITKRCSSKTHSTPLHYITV
ncbi:Protein CBR-STR-39 [Caenorhabditis briggsae]|uniref:Protein CBR-STR-39 n=2 Tax=Caenorhabditis briggsae TaxID=6238 RepID=A8X2A6_CAEBR|nr:Protein CBR-STR-39 [Caenorhabditis briggsae]CAP26766.1 Protein CBR-STR-39 [Caenorhabditis briggsae]